MNLFKKNFFQSLGARYFSLDVNQRLYTNALVLFALFCVTKLTIGGEMSEGLYLLFILFWVVAIGCDLTAIYKKIYETLLGKALLLIVFSLCANVAIVLSSQIVNGITGVDPSKFPHTVALISILLIPMFVVLGFGILSFTMPIVVPVFMMAYTLPDPKAKAIFFPGLATRETTLYPKITRFVQLISFTIFCVFIYSSLHKSSSTYEAFLTETAQSFLYQFEMYGKTQCAIDGESRNALLGDGKVLVGIKKQSIINFELRDCTSRGN